ncbi:hypothetical protein EV714DRAFT_237340 [Schizophyllum commune]
MPLRRSARARPATAAPAARKAAKTGAVVTAAAPAAVAGAPVPAAAAVTPLRPSAMPRASPLSSGDDVNDWAAQLERAGASRSRAGPLSPLTPTEDDSPRAGRGRQLSNRSEPSPPSKRARGTSSPRTMADDELYVRAAEAAEAYQELEDHYAGRFAEEAEHYQQVESAAAACRAKVKEYEQRIAALQAQCGCPFLASWGPAFGWGAHWLRPTPPLPGSGALLLPPPLAGPPPAAGPSRPAPARPQDAAWQEIQVQHQLHTADMPPPAPATRVILSAAKMGEVRHISANTRFFSDAVRQTLLNAWDQHIPLTEFTRSAQRAGLARRMQGISADGSRTSLSSTSAAPRFDCSRELLLSLAEHQRRDTADAPPFKISKTVIFDEKDPSPSSLPTSSRSPPTSQLSATSVNASRCDARNVADR